MNLFLVISITSALLFPSFLKAQPVDQEIKKGNDLYRQQQYQQAEAAYNEALAKDSSNTTAKFNRANTAYRLAKPDEAIKTFDDLAVNIQEGDEKARSYYNKGVILSNQKKLEESIEAYKNSLRQNPNDKEVRENLQKALIELNKKTPPPPKKEDEKKKQQQNQKQQPKMNKKEAEQKLKLLEQKEKELQQRLQKQKSKATTPGIKDW